MIHNGIEYGLMAAYAEGLEHPAATRTSAAARPRRTPRRAPLRDPEHYRYDFDLAEITELWRRGSVIGSWLLDLTARALIGDPSLDALLGPRVGLGRGSLDARGGSRHGVPAHVLSAALFERFASRGEAEFQNRVLSAMRFEFGGHHEKAVTP